MMFENKTAEALLDEALSRVSDKLDKREGAVIYDTLAPFCYELARAYADLDLALEQMFPQTAARDYLLLIAQQRGFKIKEATSLEIEVYFDIPVPLESRFNMQQYNYYAAEDLGGGLYRLVCETAGSAPNSAIGNITPINYIEGLGVCRFESIIKPGTDDEDTEEFRARFLDSISYTQAFGGNIADYKAKVKALDGVGQAKVFAADDWNGAGTVGIYITDEENEPVTAAFAEAVEDILDPPPKGGGLGIAPIGHIVDVRPAEEKTVNIVINAVITDSADADDIEAQIRDGVSAYIKERNEKWENDRVTAYASGVIAQLMDISGIADITSVTLNGGSNCVCSDTQLMAQGSVEVNISA